MRKKAPEKFKVAISYECDGDSEYPAIWADSKEQAEQIALAIFKDTRCDIDFLRNIKASAIRSKK